MKHGHRQKQGGTPKDLVLAHTRDVQTTAEAEATKRELGERIPELRPLRNRKRRQEQK